MDYHLLTKKCDGMCDSCECPPRDEPMECQDCGHTGTADASTTESYCGACGATVPYPTEDRCQECGATDCMLLACPSCGSEYVPQSELVDDSVTPNARLTAPDTAQRNDDE